MEFYSGLIGILFGFDWNFIRVSLGFDWGFIGVSSGFHQGFIRVSLWFDWDFIGFWDPLLNQNFFLEIHNLIASSNS